MTMASLPLVNHNSSTLRFLGILKLPDSDPNNFVELDESDVVWSPDISVSPPDTNSPSDSPSTVSNSPTNPLRLHHHHRHFLPDKSGLSAALSDDHHPVLRRKQTLNPSLSATSAARMVPPVAFVRSESSGGLKFHQSAPVNVPIWPKKKAAWDFGKLGNFDEVVDDDDAHDDVEMVPPHEIVARSHVTFSVFEGVGRTLKGRDLRRVRNAVFQKTGFID